MPKVSDKSPKGLDMPTAEQARELVIAAAGSRDIGTSVKAMLATAARNLGIGYRRARAIYHREARLIGADEWESIKRRAAELNIKQEWERAQHDALAIRLREAAPRLRVWPDEMQRDGAAMGDEGRRPEAVPATGSAREAGDA